MEDDSNLPLDPRWKQAVEDAQFGFHYGDIIEKSWLIEAFDIKPAKNVADVERANFDWLKSFIPFRDELQKKYKKTLRSVPRIGYEVVKPEHQTDFGKSRFRSKLSSSLNQYASTIIHIAHDRLSQEQAQHNAEEVAKLAQINIFLSSQIAGKRGSVLNLSLSESDEETEKD